MHFPYALQLAHGRTGIALQCAVLVTIILVPLLFIMVARFGAVGGAASWLIIQVIYLLTGSWLTHRSLLRGTGLFWLLGDVGVPFSAAVLVGVAASSLLNGPLNVVQALFWSTLSGVTALALALLASPVLYSHVRNAIGKK